MAIANALPFGRIFRDRRQAGRYLAARIREYGALDDVVVLALSRGGVPVAFEVARVLRAPLDVFMFRSMRFPSDTVGPAAKRALLELERIERTHRSDRSAVDLRGRSIVLVDDGLAAGSLMFEAVEALRERAPARIIVVVPVASPEASEEIRELVDEFVCEMIPDPFRGVADWYDDPTETTDDEIFLFQARARRPAHPPPGA
jgi:predicted phosphoribosyltransferase